MTQTNKKPDTDIEEAGVGQSPTPQDRTADPAETLSDFASLYAALVQGDQALARRKDIGELHKRLVAILNTLSEELGEAQATRAAEDRKQLVERLDEIERSINSMEGALRIELEPMLRDTVTDVVGDRQPSPGGWVRTWGARMALIGAGLFIGVLFASDISRISVAALSYAGISSTDDSSSLPPNGGIE